MRSLSSNNSMNRTCVYSHKEEAGNEPSEEGDEGEGIGWKPSGEWKREASTFFPSGFQNG
jgi:hypothetical protein